MKDFQDKVAVITGAASGIGRALAEHCVRVGMKVVLADVEAETLAKAEADLQAAGAAVLAVRTDVSRAGDVEALARRTLEVFGAVHLLCNNAGVAKIGPLWEATLADWERVLGVNLWGVIHGVRVFVPLMLAQDTDCHIVNTASLSGLISMRGLGVYNVTKHGVVTLSETLQRELVECGARIKVSVLCPGIVNTRIVESSARVTPDRADPATAALLEALRQLVQAGMPAAQVAAHVFEAMRQDQFYILTHPEGKEAIRTRLEDILQQRNPAPLGP
jgi:NAD(P)-dependent dehydrogenase (short-subunit alcohol dehydrogenase family)